MIKSKESAKHLAQGLRILGVAQFAHYGIVYLDNQTNAENALAFALLSAGVYFAMEYAGIKAIDKGVAL